MELDEAVDEVDGEEPGGLVDVRVVIVEERVFQYPPETADSVTFPFLTFSKTERNKMKDKS